MRHFFAAAAERFGAADRAFGRLFQRRAAAADYFWKRRYFIGYVLAVAVLAHAYELFNFSFSMDEEVHARLPLHKRWIAEGRWGIYTLSFLLFQNPIVPFFPTFIAVIFTALAFLVLARILSPHPAWAGYLAAPIFIACPIYYHLFFYSMSNYCIGIGLFLSSAAVWLFVSRKGSARLWALPLMVFSISIYEAFAVFLAVLFCLHLLARIIHKSGDNAGHYLGELARFSVLLLCSLLLFFVIGKGFLQFFGVERNHYPASILRGMEWTRDHFNTVWWTAKKVIPRYYLGGEKIYAAPLPALAFAFPLWLAFTVYALLQSRRGAALSALGLILVCGILLAPFSMLLMSGWALPVRTHIALPLVFSALALLASSIRGSIARLLLITCTVYCSFQFITLNHRLSFSNDLTSQADRDFALRLQKSIDGMAGQLPALKPHEYQRVEIVGRYPWSKYPLILQNGEVGVSFFEFDRPTPDHIPNFMRIMRLNQYIAAPLHKRRTVMPAAAHMPSWPKEGSIKVMDGILVIKLSDYTPAQLKHLCGGTARTAPVCESLPELAGR